MGKVLNLKLKQLEEIKVLINKGYELQDLPNEKGVLIYKNAQDDIVKIKGKLKKFFLPLIKVKEAKECFLAYKLNIDNDSHLHCEVGKLVSITYAALYGREEMLILLRKAFSPRNDEVEER